MQDFNIQDIVKQLEQEVKEKTAQKLNIAKIQFTTFDGNKITFEDLF